MHGRCQIRSWGSQSGALQRISPRFVFAERFADGAGEICPAHWDLSLPWSSPRFER